MPLIKKVDDYLASVPTNAPQNRLDLWHKLKPITCAILEKYWLMVDDAEIDYSACTFENYDAFHGKRMRKGGQDFGPRRIIAD